MGAKEPARRLIGRRVVITGASSGIGLEAARLFACEGADVALLARSPEGLGRAQGLVEQQGRRAYPLVVDVGDPDGVQAAIERAAGSLGGIDVLISNAGTAGWGPFEEMSRSDFNRTVEITFTGAVDTIRAALPHLKASDGMIVATVSVAGRVPVPLLSPYVAAKHALRGFLGALRNELRHEGSGVRVSMIHPGPIDTPFYDEATSSIDVAPKPLRSTYRTEVVARALVECAVRPRAEVSVGGSAAALTLMTTLSRPLSDLMLSTYGVWGAKSDRPARRPGSLWGPSGKGRVHGTHGGRRSVWTALRLRTPRLLRMRAARRQ